MDVRERILEAAVAAYAEFGFGATTRRVADLAGVNEVTLFRHFGSKSALMDAALEWYLIRLSRSEAPLPAVPVEPVEELYRWARGFHTRLHDARHFLRRAIGAIEARQHEASEAMKASMCAEDELRQYVARLDDDGWLQGLAVTANERAPYVEAAQSMLFGGLFGDALWRDLMPPECFPYETDVCVRQYVQVFCTALALRRPADDPVPAAGAANHSSVTLP